VLEVGAVAVGLIVACIYYGQLRVMRGQLGEIIKQFSELKQSADAATNTFHEAQTANNIAIAANRPWIAHVPLDPTDPHNVQWFEPFVDDDGEPFMQARYIWNFKNAGKRPAKVERIHSTGNWYKDCIDTPDYDFLPPKTVRPPGPKGGQSLVLPDVTISSPLQTEIPMDKWNLIKAAKLQFCIYSIIEYRDVDYPNVLHRTTDCRVRFVLPSPPEGHVTYIECANNYAKAD
jgi:hypothetical protein